MIRRYARAFVIALKMTLRGEQPRRPKHPALAEWARQAAALVDSIYEAADANQMQAAQRQRIVLRVDGRDMNMETILAAVKYHLTEEYPYLLRHEIARDVGAIYASNVNDCYWVSRLGEWEGLENEAVREALAALNAHLEAIPMAGQTGRQERTNPKNL